MFNLNKETERLRQLEYDKIHGLPYKPKPTNPIVPPIDGSVFEAEAEREGIAISRRFKSRTSGFGIRLNKSSGQDHRRRGHYKSKRGN